MHLVCAENAHGIYMPFRHQPTCSAYCNCALQAALADANITPSNNPVSTSDFEAALTSKFGAAPLLYCQRGGSNDFINEVNGSSVIP